MQLALHCQHDAQTNTMSRHLLHILFLMTLAALLAACDSGSALSVYLEANRPRLSQPAGVDPQPVPFVVPPGAPAKAAALQNSIAPGVTVAVRPGWRLEQTADYLVQAGVADGEEYSRAALAADLSGLAPEVRQRYSFLQFLPAGQSLEGYLYPDSYQLPRDGATAADLLQRQLDAFEQRVMPVYWEAIAQGTSALELHDVLTVASIVEREAVLDEERPIIAGVYLNRLARGMRLEADPTVQYAMGFQPDSGQWWKTPVFLEEYSQVLSPYNTYLNAGLPPGPIAAPRLASVQAVLDPAQHDYLYFVAEPGRTGRHVFARTFEEHLENVQRYRGQ